MPTFFTVRARGFAFIAFLQALLVCSGCGQKGPLILPQPDQPPEAQDTAAPAIQ